ncbi:hypothetical protein [Pontiella agarivorans]|uniref:Uncharacterized protein n=1 Tax=Pontiella agarivorans TaxID=3038953 RepID=A0ABU5MZV6_9BACT|nr:hypothetical protein [Pontiella agarivorans]MDZ8119738.1 hypothetical protein [Pontiella agarivorans]
MGGKLSIFCVISSLLWGGTNVRASHNPLPVRLDGALVRYNGAYYAMDGSTNGVMLVSDNLVDWESATRVLPDTVAGPYELFHRNGLFHLYAQGQGYAWAEQPLEPFSALRKTGLSGDEMRMYQDPGGVLFSVNRRSGSKKEGEVWLQRYSKSWQIYGKPDQLLDGRRGMWDSLDSADLGEPEIFAYRGNYYLLYAANNPSPRTGLRQVGVAMNENPLKLDNTDKLPDPVLRRNADRLSYRYETILPSGEFTPWRGRYTTIEPEGEWTATGYKYSKWRTGDGGFGSPDEINGAQLHACRTTWDEGQYLWVRREFDLRRGIPETPVLNIRHEGAVEVFINGKKVHASAVPAIAYSNFDISEACKGVFSREENVIAVRVRVSRNARARFIDFGLLDAKDLPVEPTVYGLNAPRLIDGPNGFEKWMLYQAWWNGVPGTGLDRVFFFDKELVVNGPATETAPGYHPPPVKPTFADDFPPGEHEEWGERWMLSGGKWMSTAGAMRQTEPTGKAKAYLNQEPRMNYLFETGIRFPPSGKGDVGVVAWSDGESDLIVSINPAKRTWSYHIEPGRVTPKKFRLPKTFQLLEKPPGMKETDAPLHRLRVSRNGTHFDIELNGIDLLPEKALVTRISEPGVPGVYCGNSVAEFDGLFYTAGWDEHDAYITGWGGALDGTQAGGEWRMDRKLGLEQRAHSKTGRAFKGDLLDQYEFTVNVQLEEMEEGKERTYGIFPVFADRNNYLKAMIDTRARELVVSGKLAGRDIKPLRKGLKTKVVHRHLYDKSTAYRSVTSWVYGLRSESVISAMDIRWLEGEFEHLRQEFLIPADTMVIKYAQLDRGEQPNLWDDGRFDEADEPKPRSQQSGIFNPIRFRPVIGNYVGFGFYISGSVVIDSRTGRYIRGYTPGESLGINEMIGSGDSLSDTMSRPQETVITLDVESSYFFRCVKLNDRVIIELNGRPMVEVEGRWPAAQVGLVTEGQPAFYNGMMLYHIPAE